MSSDQVINAMGLGTLASSYYLLRAVFIVVDILLIVIFAYSLWRALEHNPHFRFRHARAKHPPLTLRKAYFTDRWTAILKRANTRSPEALRIAIIEADALSDEVLKGMDLKGEHMADRLSQISPDECPSLPRIWRAHRLRNEIVHTPGTSLPPDIAQSAVEDYEAFLKDLGVL